MSLSIFEIFGDGPYGWRAAYAGAAAASAEGTGATASAVAGVRSGSMETQQPTPPRARRPIVWIREGRYEVRLARDRAEVESALRLRHEVFNRELGLGGGAYDADGLEFDEFDFVCDHLIVIDRERGRTVGTYRLSTLEHTGGIERFYSYGEFTIEDLPEDVMTEGIEIGRACVAADHRNTRVLLLLWRGLASYLRSTGKRYFFGCCSIFTDDAGVGAAALWQLAELGHIDAVSRVFPRWCDTMVHAEGLAAGQAKLPRLPALFEMYLRVGARVCGGPILDRDFGTIDFFVVLDANSVSERYRKLLFD